MASSSQPEQAARDASEHDDDDDDDDNSNRRTPSLEALSAAAAVAEQHREQGTPASEMMNRSAAPQEEKTKEDDDNGKNNPSSKSYSYEVPLNDSTPVASGSAQQQQHGRQQQQQQYSTPHRRHHQRRRRPRSRGPHNNDHQQQQQRGSTTLSSSNQSQTTTTNTADPDLNPQAASLQDRLTATAVAGTWDVLKALGGVTLGATGRLAAPPLHVTRTVILPQLWAASKDWIRTVSPQRLKDWYRIVSTSVYHVIHTLSHTDAGATVRHRLLLAWLDLVECLSTDAARQCLLDAASCGVKAAEALSTPEMEQFLQQVAVTGCRWVDAAADGRVKLLIHDVRQAAWAVCTLLADPETTTAVAEVTAYLCYALEMEQQNQAAAALGVEPNQKVYRESRRQERNRYQAATVNDRETLQSHVDMTVEEAILSSLGGGGGATLASGSSESEDAGGGVPQSIVVEQGGSGKNEENGGDHNTANKSASSAVEEDDHSTTTSQQQQQPPPPDWHEDARNNGVDLEFLRDGIQQRVPVRAAAATVDVDSAEAPLNDDVEDLHVVTTVESDDEGEHEVDTQNKRETDKMHRDRPFLRFCTSNVGEGKDETEPTATATTRRERPTLRTSPSNLDDNQRKIAFRDEIDPWYQQKNQEPLKNPLPLEGESSSAHFDRILHEILTQKRKAAVVNAVRQSSSNQGVLFSQRGTVRRPDDYSTSSSNKKAVQPTDSVKNRLAAIRSELSSGPSREELEKLARLKQMLGKKGTTALYSVGACVLMVFLLWGALGCYGLYAYSHPAAVHVSTAASLPPQATSHLPPTTVPSSQQEIVIRVVKEVVHVDADGKELGKGPWQSAPDESVHAKEYQKIAECVADVYS